ncbi:MAG: hypothetical protein K2I10_10365 [Lachnospiraceae bacterium]|nr:hypothetical protein [Lachnospiraceae bacterium]
MGKTTQDICPSARRIFDGAAVTTARKSNVADRQYATSDISYLDYNVII